MDEANWPRVEASDKHNGCSSYYTQYLFEMFKSLKKKKSSQRASGRETEAG